jgi:hypothetical protein
MRSDLPLASGSFWKNSWTFFTALSVNVIMVLPSGLYYQYIPMPVVNQARKSHGRAAN